MRTIEQMMMVVVMLVFIDPNTRPKKPNQINDWVFFIWSITPLVNSSFRTDSQE